MRRKRPSTLTAAVGLILSAGVFADIGTAGATTPPLSSPNPITQLAIPTTAPAVAPAPVPVLTTTPAASAAVTPAANALAPLTQLPTPPSIPVTTSGNEIGGNLQPGPDPPTGTTNTAQTTPLANVDAAVNACSVSAGLLANANSSCAPTSVGLSQLGAIANINVPVVAGDSAIGPLRRAASALALTTGQPPAQTTQNVPGFPLVHDPLTNSITQSAPIDGVLPVNACRIVVAVDASAGSQCEPTRGATRLTGSVPVDAPVTLCSIEGIPSSFCTGDGNTTLPIGLPALLLRALASSGAPLLLELLIGATALLTGLVIYKLSRRGGRGVPGATSPQG